MLMTLQLSESKYNNDYYLQQIKKTDIKADLLDTKIESTHVDITNEFDAKVKYNTVSMSKDFRYFNDDVVAYYDFSDSSNLGRDVGGDKLHGINSGVLHSLDYMGRKYSANFIKNNHTVTNNAHFENQRIITLNNHIDKFKLSSYTISLWFNTATAIGSQSLFNLSCNSGTDVGTYFEIKVTVGQARVMCFVDGIYLLDVKTVGLAYNAWHNITVTMSPMGNRIYANGVLLTAYARGDDTTYIDLSTFGINTCTIGAIEYNKTLFNYDVNESYYFPYAGYMSDIIVYNRELSQTEVTAIANNDYGYCVIALAGQSNMIGRDTIEVGIDDNYSLFNNKVYTFDTNSNINTTTSPYEVETLDVYVATNPLPHPEPVTTGRMGMFRTFCNDLVQYSDLPYRRNILIIPGAWGGTGFSANNWNKGNRQYEICKNAINAVLNPDYDESNKNNKLISFIWHQGESDMGSLNLQYKDQFLQMMNYFATDVYGDQFNNDLPVILCQVSGEYPQVNTTVTPNIKMQKFINDYFQSLSDTYNNIKIVLTDDLNYLGDFIHVNRIGQRLIGNRAYDAFIKASNQLNRKAIGQNIVVNENNNIQFLKDTFITGSLSVSNKITLAPSIYTNLSLDTFYSRTITYTCTGAYTGTVEFNYVKFGKMAFVSAKDIYIASTAATSYILITLAQIPAELRPKLYSYYVIGQVNTTVPANTLCTLQLFNNNVMGMYIVNGVSNGTPTFTATHNIRILGTSFSYECA